MKLARTVCFLSVLMTIPHSASATKSCGATIAPGQECAFGEPQRMSANDYRERHSVLNPAHYSVAYVNSTPGRHRASTTAVGPLQDETIDLFEDHDFAIEGEYFNTLVPVRISGHVDLAGILALVGMAEINMQIVAVVSDRGTLAEPLPQPKVLHTEVIAENELATDFSPSGSFTGSLTAGSFTGVQAAGTISLGGNIPICIDSFIESNNFGFETLLRRGHEYTLSVGGRITSKTGLIAGIAEVLLVDGIAPPDVLAPEFWLDPLLDAVAGLDSADIALPDLSLNDLGFPDKLFEIGPYDFHIPGFSVGICPACASFGATNISLIPKINIPNPLASFPSLYDLLDDMGLPTNLDDAITDVMPALDSVVDLALPDGGVVLSGLEILVSSDANEEVAVRDAEHALAAKNGPVASYQIPLAFGGRFEVVRGVLIDVLDRMASAGVDTASSTRQMARGDDYWADGDYKRAFRRYRQAYRIVTRS